MKTYSLKQFSIRITLAAVAAAVTLLAAASAQAALPANTAFVHGGNWGQNQGPGGHAPGDVIYNAGIYSNTTPAQAIQVTDQLIDDYRSVGMNFVRYHINPAAVSSNWVVTTNCINELINNGMYVDINCLYIDPASNVITNYNTWSNMWKTINSVYGSNTGVYTNVYFEPINEPIGYDAHDLSNLVYYPFLHNYGITKNQDHIILDPIEPGCSTIGSMSAFNGCLLCWHYYDFGPPTDYNGYRAAVTNTIYGYQNRTIMNEIGATTDTGSDFLLGTQTGNAYTNIIFMNAMCDVCTAWNMGIAWYPTHQVNYLGQPSSNNKKMFNGAPGAAIVNRSLIDKLQNFWGFYTPLEAPGCDFNNFGQTDYSVFRPAGSKWVIQSGGGGQFGLAGDIAVPADYLGNGTVQEAVWRQSDGEHWYVDGGVSGFQYGLAGDIPVPGDYLGTGQAQFAVWRPAGEYWYVNGGSGPTQWGLAGDIPVPGYYNGDGHEDFAVFRPTNSTWYVNGGSNVQWGTNGDIPVPGDYIGDGTTQFAVFRPTNSTWYIDGVTNVQFGTNGDVPVPGDYTGAGYTQIAVWRPTNGTWYVYQGSTVAWGTNGDVPVPLPYAIRHYSLGYTQ